MSDKKPIFEIQTSPGVKNLVENICTLLFDEPMSTEKQSKFGEGTYTLYTYTVSVDNVEHVMFAYSGLYNAIEKAGAKAGDKIAIVRLGTEQETTWDVEILESAIAPPRQSRPAPDRQRMVVSGASQTSSGSGRFPGIHDIDDVAWLGLKGFLPIHEQIFGTLANHPLYEDLSQDQLASLTTACAINGTRAWQDGQRPVWDEKPLDDLTENQDTFVRKVNGLLEQGKGIAHAVLEALAEMYGYQATDIAAVYKGVGLSSGDLNENVGTTWLPFHDIIETHRANNPAEQEALF